MCVWRHGLRFAVLLAALAAAAAGAVAKAQENCASLENETGHVEDLACLQTNLQQRAGGNIEMPRPGRRSKSKKGKSKKNKEDQWEDMEFGDDEVSQAVGAAVDIVKLTKAGIDGDTEALSDFNTWGSLLTALAPLAVFAPIPPPGGLVLAGALGLAGGIFSSLAEPGPGIQDVLDKMEKGFKAVHERIDALGDHISELHKAVMEELKDLKGAMDKWGPLGGETLEKIGSSVESLDAIREHSRITDLKRFSTQYYFEFHRVRFGSAALNRDNVRQVFQMLGSDWCQSVMMYKEIVVARFQWYEIEMVYLRLRNETIKDLRYAVGNATQNLRDDLGNYTAEVELAFGPKLWHFKSLASTSSLTACKARDAVVYGLDGNSMVVRSLISHASHVWASWVRLNEPAMPKALSIAVKGNKLYAVSHLEVQMFDWHTFSQKGIVFSLYIGSDKPASWSQVGKCCAKAITIKDHIINAVGTNGWLYWQRVDNMNMNTQWNPYHVLADMQAIAITNGFMWGITPAGYVMYQQMDRLNQHWHSASALGWGNNGCCFSSISFGNEMMFLGSGDVVKVQNISDWAKPFHDFAFGLKSFAFPA